MLLLQGSYLRPFDYQFGCSATERKEDRGNQAIKLGNPLTQRVSFSTRLHVLHSIHNFTGQEMQSFKSDNFPGSNPAMRKEMQEYLLRFFLLPGLNVVI